MNIDILTKVCAIKEYKEKDYIFKHGDTGKDMYIILKGNVHVFINDDEGKAFSITHLAKGEFFGEMSLIEGTPRSANVQCTANTTLAVINENNFKYVIRQDSSFAEKIMETLSHRLRQQNIELTKLKSCCDKKQ